MANTISYQGYAKGMGRTPFMRAWNVTFSGNYAQNNAEVIDFNKATNPNGLEDMQVPSFTSSFVTPMIAGSATNGYKPELQIGGNGTAGQAGIRFISGGTELAAGTYSGAGFPANGSNYGLVQILTMDNLG